MTDLEITRLCAEAMGLYIGADAEEFGFPRWQHIMRYDPLHDDAQAMALVKKFRLTITLRDYVYAPNRHEWNVAVGAGPIEAYETDLNRAICECVARMQKAKNGNP